VGYVRTAPDLVAPANVITTRAFASQINVQWDDNNTTESGYTIARSTAGLAWQDIGVVSANTTFFTDTKVETGKTYAYRVVAFNNQGASPFSATSIVSVVSSEFGIQFEFGGAVSSANQIHFLRAARRWSEVITGDLPEAGGIDDLVIAVDISDMDGVGGVLGEARIIGQRPNGLPFHSEIVLDAADFAALKASGGLFAVIVHEIGHALGIGGERWNALVVGLGGPSPSFRGARAIAEYDRLAGAQGAMKGVPVEGSASQEGSRDSHWSEHVFMDEVMTPRLHNDGAAPLSRLTVAALADLGYVVNISAADHYTLASSIS
jgi:hypothetical protein